MELPQPDVQAKRFARVREAHQTEMQEDYVELIADLIAANGEARAAELAQRFGVTSATVANTLGRLRRDGLVEMRPYRSIFLTEKGAAMAAAARERHLLVVRFLTTIGVAPETAEIDAEGLEHHLSNETLRILRDIVANNAPGMVNIGKEK